MFAHSMQFLQTDNLQWPNTAVKGELLVCLESLMQEAIPKVAQKAKEYFRDPFLKIGYSLNLVVDPRNGCDYAATLLQSLKESQLLPDLPEETVIDIDRPCTVVSDVFFIHLFDLYIFTIIIIVIVVCVAE